MKAITLDNGAEYTNGWVGPPMHPHNLRRLTIGGKKWVMELNIDPNFPARIFRHWDLLSECGNYKVSRYFLNADPRCPYYLAYEAYTWRKDMQSTFGHHVAGIWDKKFNTARAAVDAINEKVKQNERT